MSTPLLRRLALAGLVLTPLLAWWLWPAPLPDERLPVAPSASSSAPASMPNPVVAPASGEPANLAIDQRWRLLGTMVNGSDARASMASISIDGGPPRLMRIGEGLDDAQVLLAIEPTRVRVGRRDGSSSVSLPVNPLSAAPLAARPTAPEVEASPIVPPHADMQAPLPHQSGTQGSLLEQRRRGASSP